MQKSIVQMRRAEVQMQDEWNHVIRMKNASLRNKKNELENLSNRFLNIFCDQLYSYTSIKYHIWNLTEDFSLMTKGFPESLPQLRERSQVAGFYKKGIELNDKISSRLNEILTLVDALRKQVYPQSL